jgi:hypothetical protein
MKIQFLATTAVILAIAWATSRVSAATDSLQRPGIPVFIIPFPHPIKPTPGPCFPLPPIPLGDHG